MRLKLASTLFPATLALLFVGISTTGAHAYLDAGTGSMILQVILGGIAGLAIAGKLYWHRLLVALGIRRIPETDEAKDKSLADGMRADR
jgi:hypothetical protein